MGGWMDGWSCFDAVQNFNMENKAGGDFLPRSSSEAADGWSRRELLDAAVSAASRLDNDLLLLGRRHEAQSEISCREGGGTTSLLI